MSEPDFLMQNGDLCDPKEQRAWFQKHIKRIKAQGATVVRMSIHPADPSLILLEGWKEQPRDQGPIRWQMVRKE